MMDVRTEIVQVHGSTCGWPSTSSVPAEVALHDTLPRMLARNARQSPDLVAQREKEFGIWTAYTWRSVEHHVRRMSTGLAALGVASGDVVVLIGDNRPAWVWGEIAAHACGARSLGIYRDALEDEIAYLVDYASPKVVIAEDEEQVDKFLSLAGRIPSVERIIYLDPRGMRKYDDPRLMSVADLEALGQVALDNDPGCYERMVAATRADDVAILCTTSGTTSHPKLAEWTHRAFLGHAASYLVADPKGPDDEYVAVLPLSWVMEQMYSVGWNLIARMKVNFPEEQATVMADLREIGPTFLLLAPRVWEQIAADVRARMMDFERLETGDLQMGRAARGRSRRQGQALLARRQAAVFGIARPVGFQESHLRRHRRRGDGARYVQVLPRHAGSAAPALRPDRGARRAYHPPRRRHPSRDGRISDARRRDCDQGPGSGGTR